MVLQLWYCNLAMVYRQAFHIQTPQAVSLRHQCLHADTRHPCLESPAGGNTNTAFVTHHTFLRPKLPVSTMRSLNLTLADTTKTRSIAFTPGPYDALDDPALLELQEVAHKVCVHWGYGILEVQGQGGRRGALA